MTSPVIITAISESFIIALKLITHILFSNIFLFLKLPNGLRCSINYFAFNSIDENSLNSVWIAINAVLSPNLSNFN